MENIRSEHIFVKEEREKWWTSKKEHPTEKQYEYIARVAPTADCSIRQVTVPESSGSNVPDAEKRWRYSWHIAMNSNTEGRSFITEHIRDKKTT